MTALLLPGEDVHKSANNTRMRLTIARARTLTVLQRLSSDLDLNRDRKGRVIQFLYESDLIKGEDSAVSLKGANLVKASLHGLDLSGINLSGSNLSDADMIDTNLTQALLQETTMKHTTLISANLTGAKLCGANLIWAKLSQANLSGADLSGADLSEAKLNGATITQEQWEKAKSLTETIMPDGVRHP